MTPSVSVIHSHNNCKFRKTEEVLPARSNNAWLSSTFKSPLLILAVGGNLNHQFIGNQIGAAEYTASYAHKNDLILQATREKKEFVLQKDFQHIFGN